MGFFKTYDKVDNAVNRGYARWGKWIWGCLLAVLLAYSGWLIWASIWGPPTGPVTLIIHSEIDRPILGFSVNGVAGPNASAYKKILIQVAEERLLVAAASAGKRRK